MLSTLKCAQTAAQHKILQHCGNQHDRYVGDLTEDIQTEDIHYHELK